MIAVVVVLLVSIIPIWSPFNDLWSFNTGANATFQPYNPYDGSGTWYKGQLHCHSTMSDGELAPSEVAARYASLGFQFIALTDHDTVTKIRGGSLLVLGQESGKGSTESGSGHMTHMGGIDISSAPSISASQQERIDSIISQGGIAILHHPTALFYSYGESTLESLKNYTGMEIYNGLYNSIIGGASTSAWDRVLSTGKMVWGFAGDDAHSPAEFGKAWIEVRVSGSLTTANVVNAIKHGSFYATQGPIIGDISFKGKTFSVSSSGADSISFFGLGGKLLKTVSGSNANYSIQGNEGYVRAEVSQNGLKAWTQPVFIGSQAASSTQVIPSDFLAMRIF